MITNLQYLTKNTITVVTNTDIVITSDEFAL